MNNNNLFTAPHIVLTAIETDDDAAVFAQWTSDSCYIPLNDDKPAHPVSTLQAKDMLNGLLKEADEKRTTFWFAIRTRDESELLGIVGLSWVDWANSAVRMELTMRDLSEYSQPSTKETLEVIQRYVFHELQMHRLALGVPAYNEGLIHTLEDLGFDEEVRQREMLYRFGRRWDSLHYGQLSKSWEASVAA